MGNPLFQKLSLLLLILSPLLSSESMAIAESPIHSPTEQDKCVKILEEILIEVAELGLLISSQNYFKAIPLALKMSKNVYQDIICFKDHGVGQTEILIQNRITLNEF